MRDVCDGCPAVEMRGDRHFCFWYDAYTQNKGWGNSFTEKPRMSQAELEAITFPEEATPCS